ncbi:hypothetical protein ANN_04050 [Periplaneta americana]|uniref:Transposable element Tc3 transposase n=1 Tax=Periplaneta americana TaxID=6978 RepID=A0ABQ8T7H7_PERAM|nr:hypothetical protein ANN_04050 [Periplaneta americana]
MLRNFVFPEIENTPGIWWQQDGATPHSARACIQMTDSTMVDYICGAAIFRSIAYRTQQNAVRHLRMRTDAIDLTWLQNINRETPTLRQTWIP